MHGSNHQKTLITRTFVGILILLFIALIHIFRLGTLLNGNLRIFYYSYFSDIIIPFGIYFLLCINEISIAILRLWKIKALIIFSATTFAETLQGFGLYFLGSTFDFYDLIAYSVGIIFAVFFDKKIFKKYVPNWKYVKN